MTAQVHALAPTRARLTPRHTPSAAMASHAFWAAPCAVGGPSSSAAFAALLSAYRESGGTARAGDLARLLADRVQADSLGVYQHVDHGDLFGFPWRGTLWIPMFQFDLDDLSIVPAVRQVLSQLSDAFDAWDLATWFAQSNAWLDGRRPADQIRTQLTQVLDAARADHFIAAG